LGLEDLEEVIINDIFIYLGFVFIVLHETCKQTNKQAKDIVISFVSETTGCLTLNNNYMPMQDRNPDNSNSLNRNYFLQV